METSLVLRSRIYNAKNCIGFALACIVCACCVKSHVKDCTLLFYSSALGMVLSVILAIWTHRDTNLGGSDEHLLRTKKYIFYYSKRILAPSYARSLLNMCVCWLAKYHIAHLELACFAEDELALQKYIVFICEPFPPIHSIVLVWVVVPRWRSFRPVHYLVCASTWLESVCYITQMLFSEFITVL